MDAIAYLKLFQRHLKRFLYPNSKWWIRTIEDVRNVLNAGADKVALNTAAINNPALIKDLSLKFGSSTIVISIEAKKNGDFYEAYIDNGREKLVRTLLNGLLKQLILVLEKYW